MASVLITCPYCSAKLRLPSDVGSIGRIKCRACKRGFFPAVMVGDAAAAPAAPLPPLSPVAPARA